MNPNTKMQPDLNNAAANPNAAAAPHQAESPNSSRYVHCPYYISQSSPLAMHEPGSGSRTGSQLPTFRPQRHGSLGTPHFHSMRGASASFSSMRGASASLSGVRASLTLRSSVTSDSRANSYVLEPTPDASTSSNSVLFSEDANSVTLLPTRPLLKALAKQCRPSPPWCVGRTVPNTLADEILCFSAFNAPLAEEAESSQVCVAGMEALLRQVWPTSSLHATGATAAGQNVTKGTTLHLYAAGVPDATDEQLRLWMLLANEAAAQVNFIHDDRQLPCAAIVDSRTGHRCCIRYGTAAVLALAETSAMLSSRIAANTVARAVLNTLITLLIQNKILDESGTVPTMLSGEAVAIMLLAVLNSYDTADAPDAGRVLQDFFLTYGFEAYFDPARTSVSARGFQEPMPKVHPNAQLSVLDPIHTEVNVTPQVERVSSIQAAFNYCYTALSQYTQVSVNLHRAQSALSTIIGGEPYWVRVLRYYQLHTEPYFSVVHSKKPILIQYL